MARIHNIQENTRNDFNCDPFNYAENLRDYIFIITGERCYLKVALVRTGYVNVSYVGMGRTGRGAQGMDKG